MSAIEIVTCALLGLTTILAIVFVVGVILDMRLNRDIVANLNRVRYRPDSACEVLAPSEREHVLERWRKEYALAPVTDEDRKTLAGSWMYVMSPGTDVRRLTLTLTEDMFNCLCDALDQEILTADRARKEYDDAGMELEGVMARKIKQQIKDCNI